MPAYIKYRQGVVSKPTSSSTKNSPLSSTEIDGNLHSIEDAIATIESDSWVSTNRIGDSQVTPSKLSTDATGFKNKIGIQTAANGSTVIAKGTTAERDSTSLEGYFRYNITLGKPEWKNATTWITAGSTSDTVYIGTTPVALNRANAALSLTGVSIDGNAGTVTNGVYITGDQTIAGTKTFSTTISGSINGNAATVTNGVYTIGAQTIAGTKTFSDELTASSGLVASYVQTPQFSLTPSGVANFTSGSITVPTQLITDNSTKAANTSFVRSLSIGVDQTWQNLTSSRVSGQQYTNLTGKPIQCLIVFPDTGGTAIITVTVDNVTLINNIAYDIGSGSAAAIPSFIVPHGSTYKVTVSGTASIGQWNELR